MVIVPAQPVANQEIRILLDGQECVISLRQKSQGLFFDLLVGDSPLVSSVICRDVAALVCREYLGFQGNLVFLDMSGSEDPNSTGLGTRWILLYLTASEYELFPK